MQSELLLLTEPLLGHDKSIKWFHAKSAKIFKRAAMDKGVETLASVAIDCAMKVHVDLGPGLLETVYETVLAKRIADRGLKVDRQMPIRIYADGLEFPEGFRADLIVERRLLIEIKSVERFAPVHTRQVLTYLRMMNLQLGLLMNFGGITFKEGLKRVANNYNQNPN